MNVPFCRIRSSSQKIPVLCNFDVSSHYSEGRPCRLVRWSMMIIILEVTMNHLPWSLQLYPVDAFVTTQYPPLQTHKSYRRNTLYPNRPATQRHSVETSSEDTNKRRNHIQWEELEKKLQRCTSGTQARNVLEQTLLVPNGNVDNVSIRSSQQLQQQRYYKSIRVAIGASAKGLSDGDLAIQTRLINTKYNIMDVIDLVGDNDSDRATISIGVTFMISTTLAILINQSPILNMGPDIIRFLLVWIFVFAPLGLIGYGIRDAEALQTLLMTIQQQVDPVYRQRIVQHEAGHFLMGHLLGWPIQGYSIQTTNIASAAVQFYPLSDPDVGKSYAQQLGFDRKSNSRVEAEANSDYQDKISALTDIPYFSKNGRGGSVVEQQSTLRNQTQRSINMSRMDVRNDPTTTWPYRGFSEDTLDVLTMISVGGVCSEILAMGNAQGGRADFDQLKQLLRSSSPDADAMSDREMNNRLRYALGFTMSVLRRHLHQLDALAAVMEQNGSITQCIQAIETSTTSSTSMAGMNSDSYELSRREGFRSQSIVHRTMQPLFGGEMMKPGRSIDTVEDRLEQRIGGGSRKQVYRLTGDDPLYIAITIAGIFLIWALSGGLSLH